MANSTRSSVSSRIFIFWANCSRVNISSKRTPSCHSLQPPRVFTFVSTRCSPPTSLANCCIAPRPRCTCSSRSLTSLNDSPSRFSSVPCNFSSTVDRILSICLALSSCNCFRRTSTIERTFSSELVSSSRWFLAVAPASSRLRKNSSRNPRSISSNRFTSSASRRLAAVRRLASKTTAETTNAPTSALTTA